MLKSIATTWNDEFELPDHSYTALDIQGYVEYILKNMTHHQPTHLFNFTSLGSTIDWSSK